MAKKAIRAVDGDLFSVPLGDGTYGLGQVIGKDSGPLNSVLCSFYDCRSSNIDDLREFASNLDLKLLITIQFVTRENLKHGEWQIIGKAIVEHEDEFRELPALRASRFVGARILGAGIVKKFLMGFYGLYPWNKPAEAGYFDSLLINGIQPRSPVYIEK